MTRSAITRQTPARDLQALFDLHDAGGASDDAVDLSSDGLGLADGAQIATARGLVPVQTLRAGDRVVTRDNGMQRLRWVGQRSVAAGVDNDAAPVLVRAGALGHDLPTADLILSARHKVLIAGDAPRLSFDVTEVFVQVRHLPKAQRFFGAMTQTQLLFDRHEVVLANGLWCESFHPTDAAMWCLSAEQRAEIYDLFPALAAEGEAAFAPARRVLGRVEASILRD